MWNKPIQLAVYMAGVYHCAQIEIGLGVFVAIIGVCALSWIN